MNIDNIQHLHFFTMIKTLFASLCLAACCMGNDCPAKAACSNNSWGGREACEIRQESGRAMDQGYKESVIEDRLHRLEQETRNPSIQLIKY